MMERQWRVSRLGIQAWLSAAVVAAGSCLLMGVSQGAGEQAPTDSEMLSSVCLEWAAAQGTLANLGLQALRATGRIDAALYVKSADGKFEVNDARRSGSSGALDPLLDALREVEAQPAALRAFELAHATLIRADAKQAPAASYQFAVSPDESAFVWTIADASSPTDEEWSRFVNLYAHAPANCPILPALVVTSTTSGIAQRAQQELMFPTCNCSIGGTRGHLKQGVCSPPAC